MLLESALHRFRHLLHDAFMHDKPDVFLFLFDSKTGTILAASKSFMVYTGYNFVDLHEKPFLDFVHPDDLAPTLAAFQAAQKEIVDLYRNDGFCNRYRCKDGSYKYVHWRGAVPVGDVWFDVAYPADEATYEAGKLEYPQYWNPE